MPHLRLPARGACALAVLSALACSATEVPGAPHPQAQVDMATPLQLTIQTPGDASAVTAAIRAAGDQPGEPPRVRIQLATGHLEQLVLQLGSATRPLDIELVGQPGGTTLMGARIALAGHDVTVSGLDFAGAPRAGDTLSVVVSGTATLSDLSFADQNTRMRPSTARRGARARGHALALQAMGRDATAHLREIAFVDSTRAPSLAIDAQPRGRFTRVALDSLRFADTGQPAIQVGATVELTLVDVQGDHPDQLLRADSAALLVTGAARPLAPSDPLVTRARHTP